MNILITGGFGYIGSRLAKDLDNQGHHVLIGSRNTGNQGNILFPIEVVYMDWGNSQALEEICCDIDIIIHAAGMNSKDCEDNPEKAYDFNGLATARLVSSATRSKVKRFIYLSTAHVYSKPLTGSISELTPPNNMHPYSSSRIVGENAVLNANKNGEIEGVVLRLSNTFGFPVNLNANCWMLLVNDLCKQVVKTHKIILSSSGIQQRNFITLNNVSRVISHFLAIQKDDLLDGLFNVGSDYSISVLEMASNVARCSEIELGIKASIERTKPKKNEKTIELRYNISKLKSTGIELKDDMNEEIIQTLRICKNQHD
jgi:UDP-glucose 4-epimerase